MPTVPYLKDYATSPGLLSGTLAQRPSPVGLPGAFYYYATDNGHIYHSTGAAWVDDGVGGLAVGDVTGAEATANKGAANGYAPLDGSSKVPSANLPAAGGVTSLAKSGSAALTGDVTLTAGSNVTLTESGQDISIASTGGGGGIQPTHGTRVYNSANESQTNNTVGQLTFDSERYDTDAYHSTSSNTSRLTVPAGLSGVYVISGTAEFDSNSTGVRLLRIRLNGTTVLCKNLQNAAGGGNATPLSLEAIYSLAVADYVELQAFQTSGGNLNVLTLANSSPEFAMQLVGQ